ncbi:MAG: hypothetical protein Q8P22_08815, partial [Chloroflexota bacterium]|nr:hypothetical protein [Chloroflexota bacterium]
ATHSEDNCPGYSPDQIPPVLQGLEKREEIARRHGVKLVNLLSGAPEHIFFWVIEADSVAKVDMFLTEATPFRQAFRVTPVVTGDEMVSLAKSLMAQA